MHIAKLTLRNILGFEDLEIEPGKVTTIEGANGQGKTSIIEGIKGALAGGYDATLIRKGAERGEIVLVMDDGMTITKKIGPKGADLTVEKGGVKMPSPALTLKGMIDSFASNPIEFLNSKDKDRVDILLSSIPKTLDSKRLSQIMGRAIEAPADIPAFKVLESLFDQTFNDRTATNRVIREKQATIEQLEGTLPPEEAQPLPEAATLEQAVMDADAALEAELTRISGKLTGIENETADKLATIETEIADLQRQIEEKRTLIVTHRTELQDFRSRADQARAAANQERNEAVAPIREQLAQIRNRADAVSRSAATRETIQMMSHALEQMKADAEAQTARLDEIQKYKSELLASLPIDGLTVDDGVVRRHGVVFDRLNTQQQVEIAVEVAKLRSGALGVMCVDGLERLDTAHFDAFRRAAVDFDVQLFITRVSDGPLAITNEG